MTSCTKPRCSYLWDIASARSRPYCIAACCKRCTCHVLTQHLLPFACRWMKLVAETVQELHTGMHDRAGSMQLHPFHGISWMSVMVQASCQDHIDLTEAAAAAVAVVTAVASALDFHLTPEEAALCSFKVSAAHRLKCQSIVHVCCCWAKRAAGG